MESKKKLNKNKKIENKEKKKMKQEENEEEIEEEEIENNSHDSNNIDNEYDNDIDNDNDNIDTDNNWSQFILNNKLSSNLSKIFPEPTNIQKKTLIYTNAKVDLIIQARTGEGKTLCYAIPVLNYILNFYDRAPDMQKKISPVAIILVPTHELGVQVKNHIEMVIQENMNNNKKKENDDKKRFIYNIKIANVLGGFAKAKQLKRLNKFNPEIIVATPGRLWEIIDNDEAPILENLKHLKFLIVDEADRMTQTGHFKELKNIIEHIYSRIEIKGKGGIDKNKDLIKEKLKDLGFDDQEIKADEDEEENKKIAKSLNIDYDNIETIDPMALMGDNPDLDTLDFKKAKQIKDDDEEEENQEDDEEEKEEDEKENKDELEEEINEESENEENEEESDEQSDNEPKKKTKQKMVEKERKEIRKTIKNLKKENIKEGEEVVEYEKSVNLRTFLCSATIDSLKKAQNFKKSKKKKKDPVQNTLTDEQKHFQNLIKNLKFYNKLLYIKLKGSENLLGDLEDIDQEKLDSLIDVNEPSMLPSKLEIDSYKCESSIKDYYLYYILRKNINSKIIVFTNSISHTKKLYSIFSYFNEFTCCCLHSRMMQNVRMKNLEKFTESKSAILFCTDIGARGLDIPKVDLVIHYHIPTRTDIFVHRSGRTARANQSGKVSSLISGKELGLYKRTMIDLNYKQFSMNTLPLGQLEKIKSLFEYAKELERDNYKYVKENREKMWYKNAAKQCDMIYDDYGEDREDEFDEEERREKEQEKKMLNKKRKIESKIKFQRKKIYTKLNENNIKRTSFLGPDQIEKLNTLMKDDNFKNQNITQALFEAKKDLRSLRPRYKPRQRRYMKRRRGH